MKGLQTLTSRPVLVVAVAALALFAVAPDAFAQIPGIGTDPFTTMAQRFWIMVRNVGRYFGACAVVVGMLAVMFGGHDWVHRSVQLMFGGVGVFLVTTLLAWLFGVAVI